MNCDYSRTITHYDMRSFTDDHKAIFLQRFHCTTMIYTG